MDLRVEYPFIQWDEPVQVHVLGRPKGRWVCKWCVALHGLRGTDIDSSPIAFDTRRQAIDHIEQVHH